MKLNFFLFPAIFFIFLFDFKINAIFLDHKAFSELINEISVENFSNSQVKVVFMKLVKKKKRDYNQFSKIIQDFFSTMGINSEFHNWNNENLVGLMKIEDAFDHDLLKNQFKGVITEIAEKSAGQLRGDL